MKKNETNFLNVTQTKHLIKLGLDINNLNVVFAYIKNENNRYVKIPSSQANFENDVCFNTLSVDEIINLLPLSINDGDSAIDYNFTLNWNSTFKNWRAMYYSFNTDMYMVTYNDKDKINVLYELLVYCIKSGFINKQFISGD